MLRLGKSDLKINGMDLRQAMVDNLMLDADVTVLAQSGCDIRRKRTVIHKILKDLIDVGIYI